MVDVSAEFELGQEQPIEAEFEIQPDVTYKADLEVATFTKDHSKLFNRDKPNQHPIEAIEGLEESLGGLSDDIVAENERAISAEEALSDRIENLEEHAITEIIGGSNISVSQDEGTVTINSTSFIFEQAIASDTWVINHNLNKRPSITLTDSSGRVFEADREYVNENQVIIHLQSATTGVACLN